MSRIWHPPVVVTALRLALCAVFLGALPQTGGARADEQPAGKDWQAKVDRIAWSFDEQAANPFFCALHANGKFVSYDVTIRVSRGGHPVHVDVLDEGVVRHSWAGHRHTVFCIRDSLLVYAEFSYATNGAQVVAVDLETGQVRWRERCRGIGFVGHSGYRNLLNIELAGEVLVVRGNESLGRYVEIKRIDDGQTVGHKRFEREE